MDTTSHAVRQYVGARYVPVFADPIGHDKTRTYEPLTIVSYQGNSYTSRQAVPAGIEVTDDRYWAMTGNFNAQVEQYRQEVAQYDARINDNANKIGETNDKINSIRQTLDRVGKDVYPSLKALQESSLSVNAVGYVEGREYPGDYGAASWSVYQSELPTGPYDVPMSTPGRWAKMVSSTVYPESLGLLDEWSAAINYLMGPDSPCTTLMLAPHDYKIAQTVTQTRKMAVYGDLKSSIIWTGTSAAPCITVAIQATDSHARTSGVWDGVHFTGDASALLHIKSGIRGTYRNLDFDGFKHIGILNAGGYENVFETIRMVPDGSMSSIGIQDRAGDSRYQNLIMRDAHTAILCDSQHITIGYVHAWIGDRSILDGSVLLDITADSSNLQIDTIYDDTYQMCFRLSGNVGLSVSHLFEFVNSDIWPGGDASLPQTEYGIYWADGQPKTSGVRIHDWTVYRYKSVAYKAMNITPTQFLGAITATRLYGGFDLMRYAHPMMAYTLPEHVSVRNGGSVLQDDTIIHNVVIKLDGVAAGDVLPISWAGEVLTAQGYVTLGWIVDNPYNPTTARPISVTSGTYDHRFDIHVPSDMGDTVTANVIVAFTQPIYRNQD